MPAREPTWVERAVQRRCATDALMGRIRGDLDGQDADRDERRVRRRAAETLTFSECVIGYRAWNVDALGRLWALSHFGDRPWQPGANRARCNQRHDLEARFLFGPPSSAPAGHAAPHPDCDCGFYSRRRLGEVRLGLAGDSVPLADAYPAAADRCVIPVPGAVAVWGDLQVHRNGFRASHACIVALATVPRMPAEVIELLERVAARYRVPLVDIADLEREASREGSPLPDSCVPPDPVHEVTLNFMFTTAEFAKAMQATQTQLSRYRR